jgi:hypothetical protein
MFQRGLVSLNSKEIMHTYAFENLLAYFQEQV